MSKLHAESPLDKYTRVQQMILDDGQTWDLSPNDKAALRHVLGLVNLMADELAMRDGTSVPVVIGQWGNHVAKVQGEVAKRLGVSE
jgi:hypothetical protein